MRIGIVAWKELERQSLVARPIALGKNAFLRRTLEASENGNSAAVNRSAAVHATVGLTFHPHGFWGIVFGGFGCTSLCDPEIGRIR